MKPDVVELDSDSDAEMIVSPPKASTCESISFCDAYSLMAPAGQSNPRKRKAEESEAGPSVAKKRKIVKLVKSTKAQ